MLRENGFRVQIEDECWISKAYKGIPVYNVSKYVLEKINKEAPFALVEV